MNGAVNRRATLKMSVALDQAKADQNNKGTNQGIVFEGLVSGWNVGWRAMVRSDVDSWEYMVLQISFEKGASALTLDSMNTAAIDGIEALVACRVVGWM
jgi:hypothetical protein